MLDRTRQTAPQRQPMLNVPTVITVLAAVMIAIQLVRGAISPDADSELLALFAFVPARYDASLLTDGVWPGGVGADAWTFISYAFLHGDFIHIGINLLWLLAFGSPVARRFGPLRFLAFFAVTAAAGAGLHLATHAGEPVPMVGASAAIAGCMAAAIRFMFAARRHQGMRAGDFENAVRAPAEPFSVAIRDRRVIAIIVMFFLGNILFGAGAQVGPIEGSIAWEAHIGGFIAGLLLFALFDPVPRAAPDPFVPNRRF